MALDKVSNFAKTTITGIASGITEVVLDDATNFLDPASGEYNCVIWEISNYGNPADDPNKEIVRATALSGSTLTITRAQEGTADSNHNTGGETYAIANVLTTKMITDIKTEIDAKAPLASPTFTGTVTLPKTTEIQDTSADHQYVLGVSELTADRTVTLPLLTGDDTFLFKDFHKATSAEINTGTENDKYITPDALAGSNAFTIPVQQYCVEYATELEVADGVGYIEILEKCNGMNLISARATVGTPGTTNASTFDIYNVTDGVSMLSSAISIASGAKSGTGTVDTAHDDVATGDIIRIDVNTLSTTKPKGLIVTLAFRLP